MAVSRLEPAPRRVPGLLAATVTFGSVLAMVGWLVFAIGSILFWIFVPMADLDELRDHGPRRTVRARVLDVESTNARVNARRVWKIEVEVPEEGTRGTLYGTPAVLPAAGEWMDVHVAARDGRVLGADGWRRKLMPGFAVLIPAGFALAGLIFAMVGALLGRRRARLLRRGVAVEAKIVSRRSTNVRINKRRVVELDLSFAGEDGRTHEAKTRTHRPEAMDEPAEWIVYDPDRPSRVVLLDALPGRPVVDAEGRLTFRWTATAVGAVLLPGFLVAANVVLAVIFL